MTSINGESFGKWRISSAIGENGMTKGELVVGNWFYHLPLASARGRVSLESGFSRKWIKAPSLFALAKDIRKFKI